MNEDELAANFSFLTVEEAQNDSGVVRRQRKKTEASQEGHANLVFVWGLNDRVQLGGGGSDPKVRVGEEGRGERGVRGGGVSE